MIKKFLFTYVPILRNPSLMRLFGYLPPYKKWLFGALVAMIVSGGSSSLIALVFGKITDMSFHENNPDAIVWAPIALIVISIIYGGSQYMSSFFLVRVSQSIMCKIRMSMFERVLRWGDPTIAHYRTGEVQAKFINEASTALGTAANTFSVIIRESVQAFGLIALLIWHNWKLTLITFLVAPLIALVLRWVNKHIKSLTHKSQKVFGRLINTIQEAYNGSRVIRIYDGLKYEEDRFRDINQELMRLSISGQRVGAMATPLTQLITMSGVAIVVVVALTQAHHGNLTIGEFTTFLTALLLLMTPIRRLSDLNGSTAAMTAAAESLFAFYDQALEHDPGKTQLPCPVKGEVRFEHVGFTYPEGKKPALKDFNLSVKPGEVIALVGSSGSGKSTLINLIARFWTPTEGDIYVDGQRVSDVTLHSLRQNLALVSQEVVIFDDTIANNIAYGMRDKVTRDDIERVAKAAALSDMLAEMPEGLDTQVGSHGSRLSGGQRQRISIARAFLKDAPILLLDEATSALDSESEKYIQASLERLMKGRTTFVVAHRLSTIQNADRIVVMRHGEIVEIGNHDELMKQQGAYERLYKMQFERPQDCQFSDDFDGVDVKSETTK